MSAFACFFGPPMKLYASSERPSPRGSSSSRKRFVSPSQSDMWKWQPFHMSLWDGDTNLFLDEDDARGLGLSETAYHFIGGLKKHAKAYSAVTAPTVNSYKRLKLGSTSSGATWSPVWISYGYNNRTQMLRIPAPGRLEDPTVDGSTNPYLAATVILAAGIHGIEN